MKGGSLPLGLALGAEASWAAINGLVAFEISAALGVGLWLFAALLGVGAWLNIRGPEGRRLAAWLQGPVVSFGFVLCVLEPDKLWLGLPTIGVGGLLFTWAFLGSRTAPGEDRNSKELG